MTTTVSLRPVTLGTPGAHISVVGGDTALSDDSDSTYVEVDDLDLAGTIPVQFPGISFTYGAVERFWLRGRWQVIGGDDTSAPDLAWQVNPIIRMGFDFEPGPADGLVDYTQAPPVGFGDFSTTLFPRDFITPTTWDMSFSHSLAGTGSIVRVYELEWFIEWYVPRNAAPPRRLYPRHSGGSARVFPPPNTQQAGGRSGSAAPL